MERNEFKSRLKQYKKAREENPGLKYYDFMERLAEFKAKEWNDDPDMVLQHMLNDNSYNYQQMYKDNPNFDIKEGHFVDTYKTAYHPTFSEESIYSGKKSQYNPEGIIGGSWDESTKSFYLNDKRQSKRKAQDYLNYADPGYRAIPKYDLGTPSVEEWDPRITAEGYDDKGYVAIATNSMPEITVIGSKTRSRSERPMQYTYVNGYPEATTITTDYNVGAGALERVYPEFEILTSAKLLSNSLLSNSLTNELKFNNPPLSRTRKVNRNRVAAKRHLGTYNQSTDEISGNTIGTLLTEDGTEQFVFNSLRKNNEVFKMPHAYGRRSIEDLYKKSLEYLKFNKVPNYSKVRLEGHVDNGRGVLYPIFSQKRLLTLNDDIYSISGNQRWNNEIIPSLDKSMSKYGYKNIDGKYIKGNKIVGDIHPGNIGYTSSGDIRLIDAHIDGFAEGGQVEPDPLEVLERSRPKVAGIPINDRPLDTYGPLEELGMATLLGGLGGATLRGLFKNYGKMTAAIAFGDYGNENALVVKKPLRKGDPAVKPISTGNISEDTRDFYREYVMPLADHLTEQEKLDFINNDANFMYNVYPESRFDEGVLGFRNKYTGEIALNEKILDDLITFGRTMAHESDHALLQVKERPSWQTLRISRNSPRTKEQKKTRMGSNSEADATHEANKWDIVNNFELENGRKPTLAEFQLHTDVIPAKTLSSFRNRDSYGRMYEGNEIKKLAQKHLTAYDYSKWLDTSKRNTLKYVPATIPFMFATNKEEA